MRPRKKDTMPQTVTKEITFNELRKGDKIIDVNGTPLVDDDKAVVTSVTTKVAWGYVERVGHDRPLRLRVSRGTSLTVKRDEPTEEEKQAHRDEFALDTLRDHLQGMLKNTPFKALQDVIDKARDFDPDYAYNVLTWSNLPDVLKTQATYKQALAIRSGLHREGEHLNVQDATLDELVDAYAAWWYDNVDPKMLDTGTDPTWRSTSAISNLLEDLDKWAVGRIIHDVRWTGAADKILRRVEEFKAKHS
jgi:hypothetical protein